jgi:anti-anti-sigma factor
LSIATEINKIRLFPGPGSRQEARRSKGRNVDKVHIVIDTTEVDRGTVARFQDELQVATKDFDRLHAALNGGGPATLVVDLRSVSFLDSSGVRALLDTERRVRETGGRFEVVAEPGPARRTLEVAGVWEHLTADGMDGAPA